MVVDDMHRNHLRSLRAGGIISAFFLLTAGSWIYIGTQGIVQGTFETFAAMADRIDAEFAQIIRRKLLQGFGVDVVVDERRDVLGHSQRQQPPGNVEISFTRHVCQ